VKWCAQSHPPDCSAESTSAAPLRFNFIPSVAYDRLRPRAAVKINTSLNQKPRNPINAGHLHTTGTYIHVSAGGMSILFWRFGHHFRATERKSLAQRAATWVRRLTTEDAGRLLRVPRFLLACANDKRPLLLNVVGAPRADILRALLPFYLNLLPCIQLMSRVFATRMFLLYGVCHGQILARSLPAAPRLSPHTIANLQSTVGASMVCHSPLSAPSSP
jgi:hypothetical protein